MFILTITAEIELMSDGFFVSVQWIFPIFCAHQYKQKQRHQLGFHCPVFYCMYMCTKFLHKNGFLVDIHKCCLIDLKMYITSFGSILNYVLSPYVSLQLILEIIPVFVSSYTISLVLLNRLLKLCSQHHTSYFLHIYLFIFLSFMTIGTRADTS